MTILLAAAVGALWMLLRSNEPKYNGKGEAAWLRDLNAGIGPTHDAAADAFHHMGTNALPYLLDELRARNRLSKVPWLDEFRNSFIYADYFHTGDERRANAAAGFRALGITAKPAIPRLMPILKDTNTSLEAAFCLAFIGPDGIPPLLEGLTNVQTQVRYSAAFALTFNPQIGKPSVPALVKALNDPDSGVRHWAEIALKSTDPEAAAKAGVRQ